MQPAVAAQNFGVGPYRGGACRDMLEEMALIAPSQPNEATARLAPRSPMGVRLERVHPCKLRAPHLGFLSVPVGALGFGDF